MIVLFFPYKRVKQTCSYNDCSNFKSLIIILETSGERLYTPMSEENYARQHTTWQSSSTNCKFLRVQ